MVETDHMFIILQLAWKVGGEEGYMLWLENVVSGALMPNATFVGDDNNNSECGNSLLRLTKY
jgi:hypothetical protein